jgi:hypothetical protein
MVNALATDRFSGCSWIAVRPCRCPHLETKVPYVIRYTGINAKHPETQGSEFDRQPEEYAISISYLA